MAKTLKLRGCVTCLIEVERVLLADGSAVLFCMTCDTLGGEIEVVAGGPVWRAEMTGAGKAATARRLKLVKSGGRKPALRAAAARQKPMRKRSRAG